MKPQTPLSLLSTFLLLPLSSLADFTGEVETDGVKFDFKSLKQHSVVVEKGGHPAVTKTTYTINPLGAIEWDSSIDKEDRCADGTQVCMVDWAWRSGEPEKHALNVVSIADAKSPKDSKTDYMILRDSDNKVLGLNATLRGGEDGKHTAVIQLLCDTMTGAEEPDKDGKGDNALKFISYDESASTLTLEWKTKLACEGGADEKPIDPRGSWGFFTWFIVIVFLAVAAYLIFGSWLNYNKYGARGWDLLPHSDTLRDLPYLIKDFLRRAVNTFQGSGGRGGYSAI
ncbi:hypothetical protein DRE_06814 [Drechslerella stenobrocha 248]|uniref:Autophagy-related protein 27 n=1 Tax=Drechslerella stenobrocha 248 TaxID=1043628 RepID=W7HK96_9PEZI|nr:hypothetical protein DRE_06814 [Drechslerella stenobrocha 248]